MPDDTCGHPTHDGSPCKNPRTDGDTCWIPAHGGTATNHGQRGPHKLTQDLIDSVTLDLEDPRRTVRGVRAEHNIPRSTWDLWLAKGKDDLGAGLSDLMKDQPIAHQLNQPETLYGIFLESLARAYDLALDRLNRMWVDGIVHRKELVEVENEDGEVEDVKLVPKRIDPVSGDEIIGESVDTRAVRDYAKSRFRDFFKEAKHLEHSGEIQGQGGIQVVVHEDMQAPGDEEDETDE